MKPSLAARLAGAAEKREAMGARRTRRIVEPGHAPRIRLQGRELVNFSSNDYLGLAGHPAVASALADAGRTGTGSGASALVTGYRPAHQALERSLADFLGFETALLFSSGYQANLAVGQALARRSHPVAADRFNHASLNDGARLAGARIRRYRHGDWQDAERILDGGADLLATDGVFSMDGDLAPLVELAGACQRSDTPLWVDDAHGFGVLGSSGRGILEHLKLAPEQVDVFLVTFGKALGTAGAVVAGDRCLIEHLVNEARGTIYTTASPPALANATGRALELLRQESWRRQRLMENVAHFRTRARTRGLNPVESVTPIQPVIIGDNQKTVAISRALENRGYLVSAIRPPTVPAGTARLRIVLSSAHETSQIDGLIDELCAALNDRKTEPA